MDPFQNARHSSPSFWGRDDQTKTGFDVHRDAQEHSTPPPNWDQLGQDPPSIWAFYSNLGKSYDGDLVKDVTNTVENLLIFAGLFSAVVTAFISQTYPMLQPDQKDHLSRIYQELRNPGSSEPLDEQSFVPPAYAVRVNCFLFAGLFISMMVAFLSILVKLWTRGYQRDLEGISSAHLRSRIRHYRYVGAERWGFVTIVALLSIFMHLALFVSAIGIIDLLLSTSKTVGFVALIVLALGVLAFLVTSAIPAFAPDAPFQSPWSRVLTNGKGIVQSYFQFPRRRNKQDRDGTGLQDTVERPLEGRSEDYKAVRHRLDLDLEVLCHILNEADNSTQRWVLDLCFQKLPELVLLQEQHPDLILEKRVITEVYLFLSRTCMGMSKGKKAVISKRLPRAVQLCKFLSWYLSLPRTPEISHSLRERLPEFEVNEMPTALAKDGEKDPRLHAFSAKGRLKHLKEDQKDQVKCQICLTALDELESCVNKDIKPAKDPQNQNSEKAQDTQPPFVHQFQEVLVQITDCILDAEKRVKKEKDDTMCQEKCQLYYKRLTSIVKLHSESPDRAPKLLNLKEWEAFLEQKRKPLDESSVIVTEWFDNLKKLLFPPNSINTTESTRSNTPVSTTGAGVSGGSRGSSQQLWTPGPIPSPSIQVTPPNPFISYPSPFGGRVPGNSDPFRR
ncbi:hypothetical protein CPB86DRAFT_817232 [Serendipita vermifera]|nr:hypothetical protein CPB86DRAFT_817232 [Serendipita vermifera]